MTTLYLLLSSITYITCVVEHKSHHRQVYSVNWN